MKTRFSAALALALMLCGTVALAQETVTIYSAHPDFFREEVYAAFTEATGIEVASVGGEAGELLERLDAERADPRADVLWGGAVDALAAYKDLFEVYDSPEAQNLCPAAAFDGGYLGFSCDPPVLLYNRALVAEAEAPAGWADLLDEAWLGRIALCDPAASRDALSAVSTMILAMGGPDDGGWAYVMALVQNLNGALLESAEAVCRAVADGEFSVGVAPESAACALPGVGIVYPREGTSAAADGVAVVRGGRNAENARRFVDFVLGLEVQQTIVATFGRRPARADAPSPAGLADLSGIPMVDYDEVWAAENAADTLETFQDLLAAAAAAAEPQ